MFRSLISKLILSLVLLSVAGCVELGVDEQPYVCRAQSECGEGFICVRGPSCYCVCSKDGTPPNSSCMDPQCQNVTTQ